MKQLMLLALLAIAPLLAQAQNDKGHEGEKFSPEKFDAQMRQYLTRRCELTEQEAAQFFPVYKEMQTKMRAQFERQREFFRNKPQDDKACLKAIEERDASELELKRIEQEYHKKFVKVLSPSKAYKVIKAEEEFHRRQMMQMAQRGRDRGRQGGKGGQRGRRASEKK